MTDILLRVELHNVEQGRAALVRQALPWVGEQLHQGRELVAEFRLLDDAITEAQRGYLHAGVLTQIAEEAVVNGEQFPMATWKEHFRSEWLGFKSVSCINPLTGKKSRRRVRVSTEDLGVRSLAKYIDKVIAFAATDLRDRNGDGLTIHAPRTKEVRESLKRHAKREWVDPETGEISEIEEAVA